MSALTEPQEAIWLADLRSQLVGESVLGDFVIIESCWTEGAVPTELVDRASALVEEREDLRCAFVVRNGAMVREVRPAYRPVLVSAVVPSGADGDLVDAEILAMQEALTTEVDLASGRMLAVGHLRQGDRSCVFLAVHHLVSDDVDIQGLKRHVALPTPVSEPSYYPLYEPARRDPRSRDIEYWQARERLIVPMRLAASSPAQERGSGFEVDTFGLSATTTTWIEKAAAALGCTPFMLTLTGMQLVLQKHFATDLPLCLSMRSVRAAGNRGHPGMWVEPVLYTCDARDGRAVRELIDDTRSQVLHTITSQLSFVQLAREVPAVLDLMTDDEHVTVMFQHMGRRETPTEEDGHRLEHDVRNSGVRSLPVDLAWWLLPDGRGHLIRSVRHGRTFSGSRVSEMVCDFELRIAEIGRETCGEEP